MSTRTDARALPFELHPGPGVLGCTLMALIGASIFLLSWCYGKLDEQACLSRRCDVGSVRWVERECLCVSPPVSP